MLQDGTIARGIREVGRWSVRLYGRYKLAGGRLNITHDVIVIPAFRNPGEDYRILMFGAIEAPIAKGFSVRIQADATREGTGIIVAGTKQDDLAVSFGLAYKAEWSEKAAPPPSPSSLNQSMYQSIPRQIWGSSASPSLDVSWRLRSID